MKTKPAPVKKPDAPTPEAAEKEDSAFDMSKAPKFNMADVEQIETDIKAAWDQAISLRPAEFSHLQVRLPEDPVSEGMAHVHRLLSAVQEKQDTCKNFILRSLQYRGRFESLRSRMESIYERRSAKILMSMESVQALRNAALQRAAVDQILVRERRVLDDVTRKLEEVKSILEMGRVVMENLQSTDRNLSRQIKVILVQVEIGEIKTTGRLPRGLRDEDN